MNDALWKLIVEIRAPVAADCKMTPSSVESYLRSIADRIEAALRAQSEAEPVLPSLSAMQEAIACLERFAGPVSVRIFLREVAHRPLFAHPQREAAPVGVEREAWQPISTAPREGRILACIGYMPTIAYWFDGWRRLDRDDFPDTDEGEQAWCEASHQEYNPTHWMPLPAAPAAPAAGTPSLRHCGECGKDRAEPCSERPCGLRAEDQAAAGTDKGETK